MAETQEPRFTAKQLSADARQLGFGNVSERLVTDWVEIGLLDRPERRGLGRGRGSAVGTWSAEQRQLFLLLLRKREQQRHVAALCNIPVHLWLTWGDRYTPTRQVRRALATWGLKASGAGVGRARRVAADLTSELSHPDAGSADQKRLRDALGGMLYRARFDAAVLQPLAESVVDPHGEGSRGPRDASLTAETLVSMIAARVGALDALEHGQVSDEQFERARRAYRVGRASYAIAQPVLAADADTGGLHVTPDLDEQVNNACLDLLTLLGLMLPVSAETDEHEEGGRA